MMRMKNERTMWVKRNFIALRKGGNSIRTIANQAQLDVSTVYRLLDEIAAENNVARSELLDVVYTANHSGRVIPTVKPIVDDFGGKIDTLLADINELRKSIQKLIAIEEKEEGEQ